MTKSEMLDFLATMDNEDEILIKNDDDKNMYEIIDAGRSDNKFVLYMGSQPI